MLKNVEKVFIGDYIERTAAVADGADITTIQGSIVAKEIAILDKNFEVIEGASATFDATEVIYIAEGSEESFTTSNPDGTALTGRRLLISSPIDGTRVKNYTSKVYAAKSEATVTFGAITDSIVAGTEYVLRLVFTGDVAAIKPGQSIETYRYIAKTGDASADVLNGLMAKVNSYYKNTIKRSNTKLVVATRPTTTLVLTAKALPSCTTSVNDIDEFVQNNFKAFLNYVDSDGNWTEVNTATKVSVAASRGNGTWELVRDAEKAAMAYEGITNSIYFPVIKPAMRTVKGNTYDLIIIDHDREYRSPDNQYDKKVSLTEVIALEVGTGATAAQNAEILVTLNTWMASIPKAFAAATLS